MKDDYFQLMEVKRSVSSYAWSHTLNSPTWPPFSVYPSIRRLTLRIRFPFMGLIVDDCRFLVPPKPLLTMCFFDPGSPGYEITQEQTSRILYSDLAAVWIGLLGRGVYSGQQFVSFSGASKQVLWKIVLDLFASAILHPLCLFWEMGKSPCLWRIYILTEGRLGCSK